ncbi:MAG TPA: ATP-binding protein [Sandaracinaceae bacterium]
MSLRFRIIAVVIVAAVVPAGVLGWLLRDLTIEQARAEYAEWLSATAHSAARRVDERRRRDRRAIARLCEGDILVDKLLLDLEAGRFGPAEQDQLVERVPHVMRSMGLVALMLLDGRPGSEYGRVLAAGHFPGRAGARDAELARTIERAGDRWFVRELPVRRDGETHRVRALLTGCVAEQHGVRVIALGGHVLDEELVESLAADVAPVRLVLTGPAGEIPPGIAAGGGQRPVYVFEDLAGRPAARLVAVVDDAPLERRVAEIERRVYATLAVAIGIAIALGLVLAMTIARPLRELESAASRVGAGDMATMITVRSGGEVGKAIGAFNRMTAELQQAQARLRRAERIAAWRDIARRIAHEIKNPLMPIQTSIETMRKTHARRHPDFDEIFEESTLTILEEVERLKRIVTEFSRFARLPRPRPTELAVDDVAQHVVGLHAGGDVLVTMEVEGSPPRVRADREQLTQVLVNLVQNAADAARARHGESGGRVHVVVSPAESGVRIEVIDNGPGIPEPERERIFEPYYTTKAGGTGLGLAIVHRIVSDHGGRIDVDEAEGGGAVFEVVLPREGPPPEAEGSQSEASRG